MGQYQLNNPPETRRCLFDLTYLGWHKQYKIPTSVFTNVQYLTYVVISSLLTFAPQHQASRMTAPTQDQLANRVHLSSVMRKYLSKYVSKTYIHKWQGATFNWLASSRESTEGIYQNLNLYLNIYILSICICIWNHNKALK